MSLYPAQNQWFTATVVGARKVVRESKSAVADENVLGDKAQDDAACLTSGVGDFTKYGRAARARGGRHIAGAMVKGFVGHEREGEGFFSIFRNTQVRRAKNLDLRKRRGQLADDQRIVGAAAGDY